MNKRHFQAVPVSSKNGPKKKINFQKKIFKKLRKFSQKSVGKTK